MDYKLDNNLVIDFEVARYRQQAIVAVQTAFLIGAVIIFFFVNGTWAVEISIIGSGTLSAFSIYLAKRRLSQPAAMILALQFLVVPTYLAINSLGTFDSVMLLFPSAMIAMAVIGQPLQTAAFSLLTLACAGLVGIATYFHWNSSRAFDNLVDNNPIDIVAVLVIVGFGSVVATYVSFLLTGALRKLADHQATLEEQITQRTQDLASSNEELRRTVQHLDAVRAELVQGEKLASLGRLVAGVAHELNTPIGNAVVAASTLMERVKDFQYQVEIGNLRKSDLQAFTSVCSDGSELIFRSSQRAAELVASFKQVAVDQTSDRRRPFKLDEVINDIVRSMRPSFKGRDWQINCEIPPGIQCDGYPGPLEQVISNLVQNAVFHGFHARDYGSVHIVAEAVTEELVRVTIQDDGHGIAPEALQKIFDPFFTTRLGQGGSGLGLTIVHNLVTAILGGRITVESTPGHGTRFNIDIPRIAPRSSAEAKTPSLGGD